MSSIAKNVLLTETSTEPATVEGVVYVDSGTNCDIALDKIRWYNGSAWKEACRKEVAIVKDIQAFDALSGAYPTADVETTRTLNTITFNQDWVSLGTGGDANKIIIDGVNYPGYYSFEFYTTAWKISRTSSTISDDSTNLGFSQAGYGAPTYSSSYNTEGNYQAKITTEQKFHITIEGAAANASTLALGVRYGASGYDNIYTTVIIERTF